MLKTLVPATVAVALAILLTPSEAAGYGAAHVGYTHVGPNGVYHTGETAVAGPRGVAATGHTTAVGAGGGAYHAEAGGAYHAGYGGAAAGGYRYTGAYGGTAAAGGYRYTSGTAGGAVVAGGAHYGYVR